MSIIDKMMRIAGRGPDGKAKAIKTDLNGVLETKLIGSSPSTLQLASEDPIAAAQSKYYTFKPKGTQFSIGIVGTFTAGGSPDGQPIRIAIAHQVTTNAPAGDYLTFVLNGKTSYGRAITPKISAFTEDIRVYIYNDSAQSINFTVNVYQFSN